MFLPQLFFPSSKMVTILLIWKYVVCVCSVAQSCPTLCDPMGCSLLGSSLRWISRQGYWSGLPFPSPGDLPDPGMEPNSPVLQH